MKTLSDLMDTVPLDGDRYSVPTGARQVTLIQSEHLDVLASILGKEHLGPELLRRNLAISGINLLSLKNKNIIIGSTLLKITGLCHPCSRMESILGPGGYNAMRGHGGLTACVLIPDRSSGSIGTNRTTLSDSQSAASSNNYAPIVCSDYDYIELACLKKYIIDVETSNGFFRGKALDTKIKNNAEYLVIQNTQLESADIRMDEIIRLIVLSIPSDFDECVINKSHQVN